MGGLPELRTAPVLPPGVFSLKVRRVLEDQLGERDGCRRGVDRSLIVEARQERQAARVIEVRVREYHRVQLLQRARRGQPVGVLEFLAPWKSPQSTMRLAPLV